MADILGNVDTDPSTLYVYYNIPQPPIPASDISISGDVITNVTTINGGGGGRATGPSITFDGGTTGYDFVASQTSITLVISNAATARAALGAAKSGVNSDLTQFTALTGSGGWSIWTGTPDKTSHATYSGTASVGYVQAELQAVMDKLQQVTQAFKALQDTLLAGGEIKP